MRLDKPLSSIDLLISVGFAFVALCMTLLPISRAISAFVVVPFLLSVPGYTVTVALFPDQIPSGEYPDGFINLDRLVLAVTTSIALAIIVGVNLEFTPWPIRPVPVVGALVAVTVATASVGFVRRSRLDKTPHSGSPLGNSDESKRSLSGDSSTIADIAVVFAVLFAVVSLLATGAVDQRGERYTEFGLLTETESGDLSATGHPSELTVNESTTWHYTITNREQGSSDYSVVIQLVAFGSDGDVVHRSRLDSFEHELAAGESIRHQHTVTPTFTGERLRLTYLLYRSSSPEQPTAASSYRDLHVWVDVDDTGATSD